MFDHKVMSVVSPEIESYSKAGIPCGAESGQGYRSMPRMAKSSYSAPYEVYALEDYDAKYYTLLRLAAAQSLNFIYAVNPSTILLLAKTLSLHSEAIIRDIRDGTLSWEGLPDSLADAVEPYLHAILSGPLSWKRPSRRDRDVCCPNTLAGSGCVGLLEGR